MCAGGGDTMKFVFSTEAKGMEKTINLLTKAVKKTTRCKNYSKNVYLKIRLTPNIIDAFYMVWLVLVWHPLILRLTKTWFYAWQRELQFFKFCLFVRFFQKWHNFCGFWTIWHYYLLIFYPLLLCDGIETLTKFVVVIYFIDLNSYFKKKCVMNSSITREKKIRRRIEKER